ncbi:hypothetical protein [Lysobacter silvisoli]|uniref:ABC-type transport auxiliary lipoprotein component domain-containing protein n=1 Tax=Lysobacter silvisoli TaxID=2293254 RepID=A0A371K014_9GAMM|nr:hypothetical protein [Lysobacter silvisoli]RDZ27263.1 hypothetical protein DX914_13530 [Lysobacter silvisoli]
MSRALVLAVAAALALSACARPVNQVMVRSERLAAAAPVAARKLPRLSCAYRLTEVADLRADRNHAGGLGRHQLMLDDAPTLVREQLRKTGMAVADDPAADAATRQVSVQIKQLYLTQNQVTKIPVAVYSVQVDDQAPFVIRAQSATMNWNGSEDEAFEALSAALTDANAQLVATLNKGCAQPKG